MEEVGKFLESMTLFCHFDCFSAWYLTRIRAVPVNLKEEDAFHLTLEEYLLALISMIEELVRVTP